MKTKTPFSKLTKTQKRLTILKDALKWVRADKLTANIGCVISGDLYSVAESSDAQKALRSILRGGKHCEVCARGALLVATVVRTNKFTVYQMFQDNGYFDPESAVDKKLMTVFDSETVRLMEAYFEGTSSLDDERDEVENFYERYDTQERLILILENAIANKGVFKPEKLAI